MRIARACWHPYALPLARPWRSARGVLTERRGGLVRLEAEGRVGHGDCAPLPEAGTETLPEAEGWLAGWRETVAGRTVEEALAQLPPAPSACPAARAAAETALLDLLAQQAGMPLARWLEPGAGVTVAVNAVLGALDARSVAVARQALAQGFGVLKGKVGLAPVAEELEAVRRLAATLPAGARLRLDANGAWDEAQAAVFVAGLAGLPVESLEEPLADPAPAALARLQAQCPCALALDESLSAGGWEVWPVRRIVLKVPARGGLLPALALAGRAAAGGVEAVVTGALESAAGLWAAAALAAAVDRRYGDRVHGLAMTGVLARDLGAAPVLAGARLHLGERPGLGFIAKGEPP